jgi:hypothetical protein
MSSEQALAVPDPEDSIDALADPLWHRIEDDWTALSFAEQEIFGIWSLSRGLQRWLGSVLFQFRGRGRSSGDKRPEADWRI